jgi:NAD(P)-dependent dehydrogenase (short-subunit alcohol dehydrogenase family)
MFDLAKEIIVITGAAGSLGGEYSKMLLNEGAIVIGIDLKASEITQKLESKYPSSFKLYKANILKKDQLEKILKNITDNFGDPTVLLNNAAIDSPPQSDSDIEENGPFENFSEKSWDHVINVNLKGVFLCSQVFGSFMAHKKKGSIINISSIYGLVSPDQSIYSYRRERGEEFFKPVAYSVSKSGLFNFTKYLAVYWAKQNVRVNTLTIAGVFNNQDEEFLKAYNLRIPIGRMAEVHEYNGAIKFLCSEESSYMTGSNMIIDGGWTAI